MLYVKNIQILLLLFVSRRVNPISKSLDREFLPICSSDMKIHYALACLMRKPFLLNFLVIISLNLLACAPRNGDAGREVRRRIASADSLLALGKPSSGHHVLERLRGDWAVTIKGAQDSSAGHSRIRMIFGGRYVVEDFKGALGSARYEGRNTIGFNNAAGLYEATWIDSLNTGMMNSKGRFDAATDTLLFVGSIYNPVKGLVERVHSKIVFTGDDSFVLFVKSPSNKLLMELVYVRQDG